MKTFPSFIISFLPSTCFPSICTFLRTFTLVSLFAFAFIFLDFQIIHSNTSFPSISAYKHVQEKNPFRMKYIVIKHKTRL